MQQWYSLIDPGMEEAMIELPIMRFFAGIDLISDRIPDETTILTFLHLLEQNELGGQIFQTVKAHLKERGMAMKQGTIIDDTLIAVPSSTKNKEGKGDPEMHQTKKGNQWFYRLDGLRLRYESPQPLRGSQGQRSGQGHGADPLR